MDTVNMALRYPSYFGGNLEEWGVNGGQLEGITPIGNDLVLLHGLTFSSNFPVTEHAWRTTYPGGGKPFVSILDLRNLNGNGVALDSEAQVR